MHIYQHVNHPNLTFALRKKSINTVISVHDKSFEIYISENEINTAVKQLAAQLELDYGTKKPLFIGVLNGAFMFLSDLMKHFSSPAEIGFVKAASYEGMESTGRVKFHEAGKLAMKGREIIVVEDIVDTGKTLKSLVEYINQFSPKRIKICTLLLKKDAYKQSIPIDYVCFETENKFLLGYGLDYDGYGRNFPEVFILNE